METNEKNLPNLPPNYVTLVQLKGRWIEDQQRKAEEEEKKKKKQQENQVIEESKQNSTVRGGGALGLELADDDGEMADAVEENKKGSDKEVKSWERRNKKKKKTKKKTKVEEKREVKVEREEEVEAREAIVQPVKIERYSRPRSNDKRKGRRIEYRPRNYDKRKEMGTEYRPKIKNVLEKSDPVLEVNDSVVDPVVKKNDCVVEIEQKNGNLSIEREDVGEVRQIRVINHGNRENRGYGRLNGGNGKFRGGYRRFNGENRKYRPKIKNVLEKSDPEVEVNDGVVDHVVKKNDCVVEIEQKIGNLSIEREDTGEVRQIRVINHGNRENRGYGRLNGGNGQFRGGYWRFNGENREYRGYYGGGDCGSGRYRGFDGRFKCFGEQKGRDSGMVWMKKGKIPEGSNAVGNQRSSLSISLAELE